MNHDRSPKFFTDADGQRCARIQLAKPGQFAILFAQDLERLIANRVPLNWYVNLDGKRTYGHVKVAIVGDNVRTVARLIAGAGKGEQVHYRDGNRLNLCRSNLVVVDGGSARFDARTLLARQRGQGDASNA